MLDAKDLIKLAAACRKAGIKHYKQGDIEFTLTDEAPISNYKKKAVATATKEDVQGAVEGDTELTPEQKLFWSSDNDGEPIDDSGEEKTN